MGQIIGIPKSKWDYEFMAVMPLENGNFQWLANYEDYPYELEKCTEGIQIIHNVRVAHKQLKKEV